MCAAFERIELRQRVAVDVERRNLASRLLGQDVTLPLALAPIGLAGMVHADGEIWPRRRLNRSVCRSLCPR